MEAKYCDCGGYNIHGMIIHEDGCAAVDPGRLNKAVCVCAETSSRNCPVHQRSKVKVGSAYFEPDTNAELDQRKANEARLQEDVKTLERLARAEQELRDAEAADADEEYTVSIFEYEKALTKAIQAVKARGLMKGED